MYYNKTFALKLSYVQIAELRRKRKLFKKQQLLIMINKITAAQEAVAMITDQK